MATARTWLADDAISDVCPKCRHPILWSPWRQYPPAWTGARSRGEVRRGSCQCGEGRYVANRLPQELFARALGRT